jgi:hypothetical protein
VGGLAIHQKLKFFCSSIETCERYIGEKVSKSNIRQFAHGVELKKRKGQNTLNVSSDTLNDVTNVEI